MKIVGKIHLDQKILFLLDSLSVSEPPWKVSQRIGHLCPAVDEASLLVPGPHQL